MGFSADYAELHYRLLTAAELRADRASLEKARGQGTGEREHMSCVELAHADAMAEAVATSEPGHERATEAVVSAAAGVTAEVSWESRWRATACARCCRRPRVAGPAWAASE